MEAVPSRPSVSSLVACHVRGLTGRRARLRVRSMDSEIETFGSVLPDPEEWNIDGVVKAYQAWLEIKSPGL